MIGIQDEVGCSIDIANFGISLLAWKCLLYARSQFMLCTVWPNTSCIHVDGDWLSCRRPPLSFAVAVATGFRMEWLAEDLRWLVLISSQWASKAFVDDMLHRLLGNMLMRAPDPVFCSVHTQGSHKHSQWRDLVCLCLGCAYITCHACAATHESRPCRLGATHASTNRSHATPATPVQSMHAAVVDCSMLSIHSMCLLCDGDDEKKGNGADWLGAAWAAPPPSPCDDG